MSLIRQIKLEDENGVGYGVKHIENKPRVSAVPYLMDIAEGNIANHSALRKFGHNDAVGGTLEEIWDGSTGYTYLTAAEQLQVFGGANDTGSVLSSGTATGGSTTTLIDTGATFQSDGVAAGDAVLNDTSVVHGIVKTVDSETQITVELPFKNGGPTEDAVAFVATDAYRVVNANGTGAAVVELQGLGSDYAPLTEYIVMNGVADVTTTGSFIRIFRCKVIIAGSTGWNVANIDIENNASAVLLARIVAQYNQTTMALWTVPANNTAFLTNFWTFTSVSKVTQVHLCVRQLGEVFQVKKIVEIVSGGERFPFDFPLPITQKSDIVIKASASGGGGTVTAGFDLWYES